MLSQRSLDQIKFMTAMAVETRRAKGLDEATIREQARALAIASIEVAIGDPLHQETWLAAMDRGIDEAIEKTRPENR